jgi:hypothetical protein
MLRSPGEKLATVKREADLHLLLSEHGLQEVLEHQLGLGVQHLDVSTEVFAAPRQVCAAQGLTYTTEDCAAPNRVVQSRESELHLDVFGHRGL